MSKTKCSSEIAKVQAVLTELVQSANEACQFSQRETALNAERFVQTLVVGWLRKADASLNDLARAAAAMGVGVTGSALNERIGPEAVALMGRVLMGALRQVVTYPRLPVAGLTAFSAIQVTDSTQVSLPPSLAAEFRGNGEQAALKLQVTVDYLTGQWVGIELAEGRSSDNQSALPVKQAIAGSLNLFDLGYFKQERLRDIVQQQAYFVSRYQAQTALYQPETETRFDLVKALKALRVNEAEYALNLGARLHLPVRLVARRLTPKAAAARRRQAKKKYREQGKHCSKTYLFLLGWDLLLTNLAPAEWSLAQVFDLYPIRTQIEWLFRVWKSLGQLDFLGNWRAERVLCQLYAHLIGLLLCHRLTAGWLWRDDREYSFFKCVQIIHEHMSALMTCIRRHWRGLTAWHRDLEAAFRRFAPKTKRKKAPSTCQILMDWSLS